MPIAPDTRWQDATPVVQDRFEIKHRLGAGGMGVVYRAFDREKRIDVALKTLTGKLANHAYRLKHEFRAIADLTHPNLVTLYELVSNGKEWFLAMELVEGVDFIRWVIDLDTRGLLSTVGRTSPRSNDATGATGATDATDLAVLDPTELVSGVRPAIDDPLPVPAMPTSTRPPETAAELRRLRVALRQLVDGVAALHRAGKLHLDLKPSNVLVRPDGRLVILDFGLAREAVLPNFELDDEDHHGSGTPAYMAPEQAVSQDLDEGCDWYAVGVMLYEALTGCLPFVGSSGAVIAQKLKLKPPPPSRFLADLPADLEALVMALLEPDPALRAGEAELLRWLGGNEAPPAASLVADVRAFVGRGEHMEALEDAMAEVPRRREPIVVFVHGRSGMGKTSLVHHFLQRVHQRGGLVLSGRCYERESVVFKALDGVVDSIVRLLARLPRHDARALLPAGSHALARLFPALRRIEALRDVPEMDGESSGDVRGRAFLALKRLLASVAARTPVVVFVDDLHWGDRDSALLLFELLSPPDPPPMLLVGTYRSEDVQTSELLRELLPRLQAASATEVRRLHVRPLDDDEARELARVLLTEANKTGEAGGGELVDEARIGEVARESAGNPFFVGQLARFTHGGATKPASSPSLDRVLLARAAELPRAARRLLDLVAVAGQPIEQSIALAAAELTDEGPSALAVLRSEHFVRTSGARPRDPVETFHDRIRETLAAALSPASLTASHRALAVALEAGGGADPERLAHHFASAGEAKRAGAYAHRAAAGADDALAFDHAARLWAKAIELLAPQGDGLRALQRKLGDALASAGRGREAAATYLHAAHGANESEARELRRLSAERLLISGHIDEGLAAMREVLPTYGIELPSSPGRAFAGLLWRRARLGVRGLRFVERNEQDVPREVLERVDGYYSASAGVSMLNPIVGAHLQTAGLMHALDAGEPIRLVRALTYEVAFRSGTPFALKLTRTILETARDLARRHPSPETDGLVEQAAAWIAHQAEGDFVSAHAHYMRSEEILSRARGLSWELSTGRVMGLGLLFYLGELDVLRRRLPSLLHDADRRGDRNLGTSLRTCPTHAYWLTADAPDELAREIDEALRQWTQEGFHLQHFWAVNARCHADLYRGDAEGAFRRLEETDADVARSQLLRVPMAGIEHAWLRGRVGLALARKGIDVRTHLRNVEREIRRIVGHARPFGGVCAALLRAGVASASGDEESAVSALRDAIDQGERTSMKLCTATARHALGVRLGGDEGAALRNEASKWMVSQHVRAPEKLMSLILPGAV